MRITRFLNPQNQLCGGIDRGDGTADLFDQPDAPISATPATHATPTGRIDTIATRLAPIAPANFFCIGANYRAHIEETGRPCPSGRWCS